MSINSDLLQTRLCEYLGCKYPIIQTAMGWVSTPQLVISSSNAGAFGFLAGAVMTLAEIDRAINEIKANTDSPFGLNFHFFHPEAKEIIKLLIKKGIKAVSYGRSPNKEFIKILKDAGVLCIPTVGAVNHAVKAEDLGADIVVIQGSEGGGHTGRVPTEELLSQVLNAVNIPVVAAGGFRDGKGLVLALKKGAIGIAMGTRFMMTTDSPVPESTLKRYLEVSKDEITVTAKFDGLSHRLIRNKFIEQVEKSSSTRLLLMAIKNSLRYKKMTGSTYLDLFKSGLSLLKEDPLKPAQALMAVNSPVIIQKAMVEGLTDEGAMPTGLVAGEIDNLLSCEELIQSLIEEAKKIYSNDF
ncbi:MAG: 2-nitropropane dioxygenase [Gammaproteobacteria bacterium]|nr:2-nitropropane dioxygenase [Gammaproteobacteria bacterium]|tara:strand:+ start:384 stop:1445 length:1062 start_codon:yes stop_codon:yes gene_type:complete